MADSLFKKLGGKYSKKILADLAEGRISDLPMDILDALRDATDVEDFVRRLVGNQVLGLVGDSAAEGLDALRKTVRKQGDLGLIAPGQSGKMKSDSDFDVDADAPSLSVGKNSEGKNSAKTDSILPQYDRAFIPVEKLTDYALNMNHRVGKNKALVFERVLGYNSGNANHLIEQVYEKYLDGEITLGTLDDFGQRYTIDIDITGPNGKNAIVRTDWIFSQETQVLRLTTIYVK